MKPILVLSETHGLMPLAAKLRAEGRTVHWMPVQERFRAAWSGSLDAANPDDFPVEALDGFRVLSDSPGFTPPTDSFPTTAASQTSPLRVCGWWDGEYLHAPHLLVVDMGEWPGGMGARVAGGATLVAGYEKLVWESLSPSFDAIKSSGHRGLVAGHLDASITFTGWTGGWERLHFHAWLASLETPLGEVLDGVEPKLVPGLRVVLPVTVPNGSAEQSIPVDRDAAKRIFWHDVRVEDGELRTAGLDGFVAVVHGAALSSGLARKRALDAASQIGLVEKQLRMDVGAHVDRTVAGLEEAGWTP